MSLDVKDGQPAGGEEQKVTKEGDTGDSNTHAFMVLGTRFEIEKRYEVIDPIGSGAYGVVVAARDNDDQGGEEADSNLVAIKKIIKAFEHRVFALRTYRELKIQRLLDHENILGIKRILLPKDNKSFNEIYVVTELMETDLA